MAPIDWNEILKCRLEDINDEQADNFYKKLVKFNPLDEDDPIRLQKLFMITRNVLQLKGLQAEVAMEELEQMAKNQGRLSARHEKQLLAEIQDLKEELGSLKGSRKGSDTSLLKHNLKIEELEQENKSLKLEIDSKDTEVRRSKRELEKALEMVEKYEEDQIILREEAAKLQDTLEESREMTKNIEESREENCKLKEKELLTKIKSKNQEIHQLLNDVKNLETENSELSLQKSQLHEKFIEAVNEMEKTTQEYIKLKEAYDRSETNLKDAMEQNKIMVNEIEDLKYQLSNKGIVDDEIMETVSRRVEEWKVVLRGKEQEIIHQNQIIAKLKAQFDLCDVNVVEVQSLKKALEDRDSKIEVLKEQLQQATQDLEENSKLLEELRVQNKDGATTPLSPGRRLGMMIESQNELKEKTIALQKLKTKLKLVEDEWKMKDQELSDALARMRLYEMGEYGLADAVLEIKDCKNQIRLRNKQIEELTQQFNETDFQLGELFEENQAMREKLNLTPKKIEPVSFKRKGGVKIHTLTQRLQEKVDTLEDENVELRSKLHQVKRSANKRTSETNDSENQAKKSKNQEALQNKQSEDSYDRSEIDSILETIEKVRIENGDLRMQLHNFECENKSLYMGMKEILQALREQDGKADVLLKCPTLEELVQAIEVREISGCYDPLWILKCQVDQLQGQNEALRGELKCVRQQAILSMTKLKKSEDKIYKVMGEHGSPLSSKMSQSSENEHLFSLEKMKAESFLHSDLNPMSPDRTNSEMSKRSDVEMSEGEVVSSLTYVSDDGPRVSMLYQSIISQWEKFHEERRLWRQEVETELQARDTLKIRLEEFENLILTLKKDDDEIKQSLGDSVLNAAQLTCRVNFLNRRLEIASGVENDIRKERDGLKTEILNMESHCFEKINYLLRFKERAHCKILALQKMLDDCLPSTELELANRNFLELNMNYQKLLSKQSEDNIKFQEYKKKEDGFKKLNFEHDKLRIEFKLLEEKNHIYESQGKENEADLGSELKVLKLKEINERQRADHLLLQYEQLKIAFGNMEDRNSELESKFADITRQTIELKDSEHRLKEDSVSKEVHMALNKNILELEKRELSLQEEAGRFKAALESAKYQIQGVEKFREVTEKELEMSRTLLLDMQASSDEKLSAGILYRQIIGLQLSETRFQQELGSAKLKLENSEKINQSLQKKCAEREDEVFHTYSQARSKILFLTQVLYELRRQFSSSIPIAKQEDLILEVKNLTNERNLLLKEVENLKENNYMIGDEKLKLSLQLQSVNEVIETLKSGSSVEKIIEWHKRIDVVQMREARAKRMAERYSNQTDNLNGVVKKLEDRILRLEELNLRLESKLREKELEIDSRNLSFLEGLNYIKQESALNREESHEENTMDASQSLQELADFQLQNRDLEEDSVLSEAMEESDSGSEIKVLRETIVNLERRLKDSEDALVDRDTALNELISRMPSSLTTAPNNKTVTNNEIHLVDYFETKQNLSVAQATIDCLQARVNQKEESILRYQDLITKLKDDTVAQKLQYEKEILELQSQIQNVQRDYILSKNKNATNVSDEKSLMQELNSSLLQKITELEESFETSKEKVSSLFNQLNASHQETVEWKIKASHLTKLFEEEQERTREEMQLRLQNVEQRKRQEQIIRVLNKNLEDEVNHRPAQVIQLKLILKDLKRQIFDKEKQLNELNTVINKFRSEINYLSSQQVSKAQVVPVMSPKTIEKPAEEVLRVELVDRDCQTDSNDKYRHFQEKVIHLDKQKENLKKELIFRDEQINELTVELDAMRMSSDQNEDFLEEILRQNEDLKKRLEKSAVNVREPQGQDDDSEEVSELKQRIRFLEEQIKRHEPPEKPYVEDEKTQKSREELLRWEESKKWQQTIERLKTKVKEKEQEVIALEKSNKALRDQVIKISKDKTILENKVKALSIKSNLSESSQVEALKKQISTLEQLLDQGDNRNGTKVDSSDELKTKNKILVDKIFQLEKQIAKYSVSKEVMAVATREIFDEDPSTSTAVKYNNLQKHVLKLSEENFQLKVEVEQLKIDIPRLKIQISTLEGLNDVIKSDLMTKENVIQQLTQEFTSKDVQTTTQPENNQASEKAVELEAPRYKLSDQKRVTSSMQRLLDVKTNKIVGENTRLQNEIKKYQRENDQLFKRHKEVNDQNKRVLDSLEEKEKMIKSLKKQIPTPHSMPPRQYKSYVVTKLYEEKISNLEKDLAETKEKFEHSFKLLKEQTEKDEHLKMETNQLKLKIESLEKYTLSESSEDQLPNTRKRILELENENQLLLGQLLHYDPKLIQSKENTIYDTLLKENAELRVRLRMNEIRSVVHA